MFFSTVDKQLLLLIDQLAVYPEVAELFYLAGGTGLALQLHETSTIKTKHSGNGILTGKHVNGTSD